MSSTPCAPRTNVVMYCSTHELAALIARLGVGDDGDAGGALAHADRRGRRAQRHPGLDRPVVVEVLLAVKDRAEQLAGNDLHGGHPGGLEGGHDREDRRRELAGRVGSDRVVGRGRVGGEALLGDLELDGIAGGADRVGLEGGGCLGIAHAGQRNKPDTCSVSFRPHFRRNERTR